MFYRNKKDQRVFRGGKEDWNSAVKAASICCNFTHDVEEELITDDEKSCYDCLYRRWTAESFICCRN